MVVRVAINRFNASGFTLLELMVVVALVALVVSQGIPWLQSTTLNSRRTAQVNEFVANLNAARAFAIAGDEIATNPCTGCNVTMCKTTDGTTCETLTTEYWESGWLTFWDEPTSGTPGDYDVGGTERLIRVRAALEGGSTLRGNLLVARRITFDSNGFTGNNGTFIWCDSRGFGGDARGIIVGPVGRVRTLPADDADVTPTSCSP